MLPRASPCWHACGTVRYIYSGHKGQACPVRQTNSNSNPIQQRNPKPGRYQQHQQHPTHVTPQPWPPDSLDPISRPPTDRPEPMGQRAGPVLLRACAQPYRPGAGLWLPGRVHAAACFRPYTGLLSPLRSPCV